MTVSHSGHIHLGFLQSIMLSWLARSPTTANRSIPLCSISTPFHENKWDTGLVYFNGGIVTNQYGTFNTGNESGLMVDPVDEISYNIPNGNYTMNVQLMLFPVSVFGPYHLDGYAYRIEITFPVEVYNNTVS